VSCPEVVTRPGRKRKGVRDQGKKNTRGEGNHRSSARRKNSRGRQRMGIVFKKEQVSEDSTGNPYSNTRERNFYESNKQERDDS